jgi:oligoendopeptidase F
MTPPPLPLWDLKDLYRSLEDPTIETDIAFCTAQADALANQYQGQLATVEAQALTTFMQQYEGLYETLGRLESYAGLLYYTHLQDAAILSFFQRVHEVANEVAVKLVFASLELNELTDEKLAALYSQSATLTHYKPFFERIRLNRPHQLSQAVEEVLTAKALTSSQAWVRLYDEQLAAMTFDVNGQAHTLSTITELMSSPQGEVRKAAALALSEGLTKDLRLLTHVTNVLAKDKSLEDGWRHYESPHHSRHIANQIEPSVVEALYTTVKANYSQLSHRYYAIKAKLLGLERLEYWDRNAPLPGRPERKISWDEAKEIVLRAYRAFSPTLADVGQLFFDNPWIDVPPYPGKTSGAFAHPCVPSAHPYLMLNYQGTLRDVMTLAHELGHGVHQYLCRAQGYFLADTPLTLAETASVFGEMLTFQALLANAQHDDERTYLLAAKIDDMLNTVVRQIAFYDFEIKLHTKRKEGELSAEAMGELWLTTQREALGPAVNVDPRLHNFWGYISHFIHTPFYVYAYAFGDCLVNSLYAGYQKQPHGFEDRYIALLKAGGSKPYGELLAPFNLNAQDPAFWQSGLSMLGDFISQLEAMTT